MRRRISLCTRRRRAAPCGRRFPAWRKSSGFIFPPDPFRSGTPEGKIRNTAYVFDRQGNQIAKHSKVHLFDIDVKGGQSFKESDTLTPGDHSTVFETEFGIMGLCICFDFRFPELARRMALDGAKAIFVPAAFNMTTGPAHWEVMFRSRPWTIRCLPSARRPPEIRRRLTIPGAIPSRFPRGVRS